jgi:hypothetical protein
MGESKEYEVESAFSEDATSDIQDPSSNSHLRATKRNRGKWTLTLSGTNDKFRKQENRVVD